MNWRIALGGFVLSAGFIGGWVEFGTVGGALFSSLLLAGLFLADWMIDRFVYGI
ncbi:hypothetical protein [Natrinema gari]|uniref:hypothetical protein n=1 Tax=Natrinema gari TaxID=419186 RepID=UPI00135F15FF|nr:hypothetical protein [Natrinema gari]